MIDVLLTIWKIAALAVSFDPGAIILAIHSLYSRCI